MPSSATEVKKTPSVINIVLSGYAINNREKGYCAGDISTVSGVQISPLFLVKKRGFTEMILGFACLFGVQNSLALGWGDSLCLNACLRLRRCPPTFPKRQVRKSPSFIQLLLNQRLLHRSNVEVMLSCRLPQGRKKLQIIHS